ncbi:MAG: GNAT family N-acetyltransferase [Acidimicrobiales bacterium]|nr:GNAT family N-acetyltransferase [Acidimicrobiales bacterium]
MGKIIPPVVASGSMTGDGPPVIDIDDAVRLRAWRADDAGVVVDAFADPDIQRWHFRRYDTEREALDWIEATWRDWRAERAATWAVVWTDTDEVAGRVTVYTALEDGHGEVSYWMLPQFRRRGIASRACTAATRWAHALGLHRIQLEHSVENDASEHVALRCRFHEEGVRRGATMHADGWHDMRQYAHLATD